MTGEQGRLTANFFWDEVTYSDTALEKGIDNSVPFDMVPNVRKAAERMESVRVILGSTPITVTSWFRSHALNAEIKGSLTSSHLTGLAVDFKARGAGSIEEQASKVWRSELQFDQLILYPSEIRLHIGFADQNRREVRIAKDGSYPLFPREEL